MRSSGGLERAKINNAILVLSAVVVLFHIFLVYYFGSMVLEISQEADEEARDEMLEASVVNAPFIITVLIGACSVLILPAAFFIKNRGITDKKWLLAICAVAVYLLSLYLLVAVACLGIYLWNMWEEFQSFRKNLRSSVDAG